MQTYEPSFERATSPGALSRALDHIRKRSTASGVDRVSPALFAREAGARLQRLSDSLRDGSWRPQPGLRLRSPRDPSRELVIPTVGDRVVQRAVALELSPFYDPRLSRNAWAYRPGRSVGQAVAKVERMVRGGRGWYARTDIEKFFDRIERPRLLGMLAEDGLPAPFVELVGHVLTAGALEGAVVIDSGCGVPQGSSLSPLLSNVYLRDVDAVMERRGFATTRYADDILVLAATEAECADALACLGEEVERLGLRLSPRKTVRGHAGSGFVFLGVRFDAGGRAPTAWALETLEARAGELLGGDEADLSGAVALVREWERWYGPVPVRRLRSLAALAATLGSAPEDLGLVGAAARRRVELGSEVMVSPPVHEAMLRVWTSSPPAPDVACAALLDAARIAASPGGVTRASAIADLLAAPPAAVSALERGFAEARGELGRAGCSVLADAARRLVDLGRWQPVLADAPPSAVAGGIAERDLEAIIARLDAGEGRHGIEAADTRGHSRLTTVRSPLTATVLRRHLAGELRAGVYPVRSNQTVRFALFSISVKRDAMLPPWASAVGAVRPDDVHERWQALVGRAHDHAVALGRAMRRRGLDPLIEDTGTTGRRIWVLFAAPVELRHVHALLLKIEQEAGAPPAELHRERMPAGDRVSRAPGPVVLLPYGVDARTGKRSVFVDVGGLPSEDLLAPLLEVRGALPSAIRSQVVQGSLAPPEPGSREPRSLQLVTPYPAAARIVAGCGVVRALAEKSCALGFLERDERASLLETMSLLPEAQAHGALSVLLGVTGGPAEADLRRHLRRPLDFPVSCARMRQRHAAAASAAGCTCVFHGLWGGAYPAPILHALRPTDIPALRKRMEESRQRSRRPARPEPVEPVAERPIARPPRGDGRDAERAVRVPSSGAPQPRAAEGDLGARVEALYRKLVNLRKAADEAAASALRTEAALAKAFEEAGVERFRVAEGWLTRLPGDRPRFVIDLG